MPVFEENPDYGVARDRARRTPQPRGGRNLPVAAEADGHGPIAARRGTVPERDGAAPAADGRILVGPAGDGIGRLGTWHSDVSGHGPQSVLEKSNKARMATARSPVISDHSPWIRGGAIA